MNDSGLSIVPFHGLICPALQGVSTGPTKKVPTWWAHVNTLEVLPRAAHESANLMESFVWLKSASLI